MYINWFYVHFTLFLLLTYNPLNVDGKEKISKPSDTHVLCGYDFVKIYDAICKLKQLRNTGKRDKRSVEEILITSSISKYKKVNEIIDSKNAKSFLSLHSRRRRATLTDNASEECCIESCTFSEIQEYPC